MQYSQRDPNRDHRHGRIYRLVYKNKPLLEPTTQAGKTIPELLEQLKTYEPRTRYRARRELRDRDRDQVLAAVDAWLKRTRSERMRSTSTSCVKPCGWKRAFEAIDEKLFDG